MKIGIVAWDLNISGGTQRQALELAIHLQKIGYDVKVYSMYYNNEKCYPDLIKRLEINYLYNTKDAVNRSAADKVTNRLLNRFFLPWQELLNERKYYKLLNMIDPDIELLNCHDYGIYPLGAKFKERYKKPIVYMMNDLPVYKNKLNSAKEIIKLLLSPIRGDLFYRLRHKHYISTYDRIVVLDNYNKKKLKDNLKLDSLVIRSGLDTNKFRHKIDRQKSEKFMIFANGIFFPYRRFEDIIKALKILKNKRVEFKLNHIGTDVRCRWYAEKIYNMVKKFSLLDYVKFHGHVSEEKLIELYSISDIFVFPNYPQTWGLAVFEAMSCGTPVIVSTGCGASEVLTDGENAILVPPKSPEKIAEAIIKLKENPDLWRKLSENGRKFVEKNIRWDLYAENMMKVFKEVLINK